MAERSTASANPFKAIALMLKSVREALEGIEHTGQPPRWVRIARIRDYQGATDFISKGVIPAVDKGLVFSILYLTDLTLKAKDLLFQSDSAKALIEVSGEMLKTITTNEFAQSLAAVVGREGVSNPLAPAGGVINVVLGFVDKIPGPEDLEVIGKELYGLLCIEQPDGADLTAQTEKHINIDTSGKVRLLQMALTTAKTSSDANLVKSITVPGLGNDKAHQEQTISWLGGRRVTDTITPTKALGVWSDGTHTETVYEFSFEGSEAGKDIAEANLLMERMGYPALSDKKTFNADFTKQLKRFQFLNNLRSRDGILDNATLNQLWHLDFDGKTLKRAAAYDATKLPPELK